VAVLAHPSQLKCNNDAHLLEVVRTLMDYGLEGLEVYHSDCDDRQMRTYLDLAKQLGLYVTGGSDFHGQGKPDVRLGHPRVPASMISDDLAQRIYG
jgi:predicted metal-dependent phosphoesterase TrpH